MKKLGFTIKVTIQGNQTPAISINAGEWMNQVSDVRNIISARNGTGMPQQEMITVVSFTSEGMIINLIREISGRPSDNTAAWIYIPADADINGQAVTNIITTVKRCISKTSIDADTRQQLQEIFSHEYPSLKHHLAYAPSAANGYAYRLTGDYYTLQELLGEDRYQKFYSDYKAIFLIDANDKEMMTQLQGWVDLSNKKLEKYCSLLPHDAAKVKEVLGNDISLCIDEKGTPFDSEISGFKDEEIILHVLRKGFRSISFHYVFKSLGLSLDLNELNRELVWKRMIGKDLFKVTDAHSKQPLCHCTISINGAEIGTHKSLISEADCQNAKVVVVAKGYDKFEKNMNLLHINTVPIALMREERSYEYTLQLNNGSTAEMELKTREILSEDKSPLVGYEINYQGILRVAHNKSRFGFRSKKRKTTAICLAIAYVVALHLAIIIMGILWTRSNKSSIRNQQRETQDNVYYQDGLPYNLGGSEYGNNLHNDSTVTTGNNSITTPTTDTATKTPKKKDKTKSDTKANKNSRKPSSEQNITNKSTNNASDHQAPCKTNK